MKLFLSIKKKTLIIITFLCLVVLTAVILLSSGYVSAFNGKRRLPIYSVERDEKMVALTFDCAWGVDYTDKLISIMKEEGVTSTFFMVEFWTRKYPDYVKKLDDAGFEIGTHSSTHPYMSKLDRKTVIKELNDSSLAITEITGKKVEVFRPPYGDYNDNLIECCQSLDIIPVQWDVDSLDWKNLSSSEIENRVMKGVKKGSIILFHNNGLHTAEALPNIIKRLKSEGYSFSTVGNMILRDNYYIDVNGRQIAKK